MPQALSDGAPQPQNDGHLAATAMYWLYEYITSSSAGWPVLYTLIRSILMPKRLLQLATSLFNSF